MKLILIIISLMGIGAFAQSPTPSPAVPLVIKKESDSERMSKLIKKMRDCLEDQDKCPK